MRRTYLRDHEEQPDLLVRNGFTRRDEPSADLVRRVWVERAVESNASRLRLVLSIEFEMGLPDHLGARYRGNVHYSFNGVVLRVIDRRMQRYDSSTFDSETEHARLVGEYRLAIDRVREIEELLRYLQAGNAGR